MLAALIALLPGTVLLGALGAILFLLLVGARIYDRTTQQYGRHGQ